MSSVGRERLDEVSSCVGTPEIVTNYRLEPTPLKKRADAPKLKWHPRTNAIGEEGTK
jgi:hypothetical protein